MYVAQSSHQVGQNRIRKFSLTGQYITKYGSPTDELGKVSSPVRVAFDTVRNIYVADQHGRVQKFNPSGQFIMEINGQGNERFQPIEGITVDNQGNLYVLESTDYTGIARIQKFTSSGKYLQSFDPVGDEYPPNSYKYMTGIAVDGAGNMYVSEYSGWIRKLNPAGQLTAKIGLSDLSSEKLEHPRSLTVDRLGNIYVLDDKESDEIIKFDAAGKYILRFAPNGFDTMPLESIAVDVSGNIYVGDPNSVHVFDATGKRLTTLARSGNAIAVSSDGYRIAAATTSGNAVYLLASTQIAPSEKNFITGTLFEDQNNNCTKNLPEPGIPGVVVAAEPGPYYGVSDELGNYTIQVDTGSYTIRQILPQQTGKDIRQTCPVNPSTCTARFDSFDKAISGIDFGNQVTLAPFLSANVSSDRRRRCFTNQTTITYSNTGFAATTDAKVYVQLPEHIAFKSADKPFTRDQAGNYVFDVGTLQPNQAGTLHLSDSVICGDESIRNLTVCTKAWITPFNNYTPPTNWDQADIMVAAQCKDNGFVRFVVKNAGQGSMADSVSLRIFLDAQLALTHSYRLMKGDSLVLQVPANGRTARLEADQTVNHPRKLQANATVEGCGKNANGSISTGFVNALPPDDAEPEVSVDCKPILDSYDPNDKLVSPAGVTAENYTPTNTELRYQVRFQNTGTDVAYRVVVVDTLSEHLDMATLQMGTSSHPYRFELSGKGHPVLTWTFDNINLPDSAQNQEGSNGFIQFSIKPKADLPEKTKVENFADIFFDYNSPIRTNIVENRLYDMPPQVANAVRLNPENVVATPLLSGFSPAQGQLGATITLTGKNFAISPANNQVRFNGVLTTIIRAEANSLTVRVPNGAITGRISVQTADGTSQSSHDFLVFQPPTIASFTPQEAVADAGTLVTLQGTNFSADIQLDTLTFNGVPAKITRATTTSLTAEIPAGITTGKIRVGTLGGNVETNQNFVVWYPPVISSVSPLTGKAGTEVTLVGQHFADQPARNLVKFGEVTANVHQASANSLVVKVPANAQTGQISVVTPGGMALSSSEFVFLPTPVLMDFNPKRGIANTIVTLTGINFKVDARQDTVRFNGVAATILRSSANSMTVQVPKGTHSGKIAVAGMGGQAESTEDFLVDVLSPEEAVQIYPNPTDGRFVIDLTKADFAVRVVRIYNVLGQLLYSQELSDNQEDILAVDLPHYTPGLLVVFVQTDQGTVVKKLGGR
jgi:uncharacterized repeat protein (TIGR01451 family)